ncbi:MAG: hypothetical protein ABI689_14305 [Thermoanaerobaculia bacterium]
MNRWARGLARPRGAGIWGVAILLAALFGSGGATALHAVDPAVEILHRDCSNRLGRNEVTLFANGTIRWREWQEDRQTMRLTELGRDEVEAYVRRLEASDLSGLRESPGGVAGDWVERCELVISLPDAAVRSFEFGRLDTHPLALADLLRIAEELAVRAQTAPVAGGLPADYLPRFGDLLLRVDDVEFEVVGQTVDGHGFELRGKVQPLSMYLTLDELHRQFVRLLHRGPSR